MNGPSRQKPFPPDFSACRVTKDENRRLVTIDASTGIEFFNELKPFYLKLDLPLLNITSYHSISAN